MPKPFRYGTCAVIALIHDALVTLGIYAVLGYFFNWEINLIFITGILALIGYSVNNIVVIFDRIRENTLKGISKDFWQTVNHSVIETLTRSMNTSITTLIAVLSIMLFVGSTIQNFAVVLIIGIIVGTFDSIFVAPALLVTWDRGDFSKLIPGEKSNAGA